MSDILAAAKALATDSNGLTALHRCTTPKDVEALVALGLNVNAKNAGGWAPLDVCKTDEMRALLFARKVERIPKDLLAALKDLLAQYE